MKKDRMNIQTITEVLIDELEHFQSTAKSVEKVLPAIDTKLVELQSSKLQVETKSIESVLKRFEELSTKRVYYPKGIVLTFIVALILAVGGIFFSVMKYKEAQLNEELWIREANRALELSEYLQNTKQGEKFDKWRNEREKE